MKYCANTVLLPEYDLEETVDLLCRVGFGGVEWRVRRIPEERRGEAYSPWGNVKNDLPPERLATEGEPPDQCALGAVRQPAGRRALLHQPVGPDV